MGVLDTALDTLENNTDLTDSEINMAIDTLAIGEDETDLADPGVTHQLRNVAARKFKMEKRAAQPSSSAQLTREKHVQDLKWTDTKFWRESLKTEKNINWTTDRTEIYKTWNICQKYDTNKCRHKKSRTARIQHWLFCVVVFTCWPTIYKPACQALYLIFRWIKR